MVTDSRSGNANSHSTVPFTTPMMGGKAGGGLDAEMRVDDGAEFRGRLQSRHEVRRDHRRHGKDHVVVLDRQLVVAEIQHGDLAIGEPERPQPVSELDLHIVRGEKA